MPSGASSAALLEEIAEAASTPSGAESLAKELNPETLSELGKALARVQAGLVTQTVPLTTSQKVLLMLESGIPFIGFGFVDNSGMLIFGDQIDVSLGVTFALSAMASAALGNMLSDVLGISMGSTIAAWAGRLGLPAANLSLVQSLSVSARRWRQFGATVGVIIGCLLGMFPLLFIDSNKTHRMKRSKLFDDLFGVAISFIASPEALDAESATLFVVDRVKNQLWTRASKELATDVRLPLSVGLAGFCVESALTVNVDDPYRHPRFLSDLDKQTGTKTRSVLCTPVFDRAGNVIGVLEVINKRHGVFSLDDERSLSAIAAHVAVVLEDALVETEAESQESESQLLEQLRACTRHSHHRFNSQRYRSSTEEEDLPPPRPARWRQWWQALRRSQDP